MKVAFIDRDGTLIWEPPDTKQIDSIVLLRVLPDVVEGLRFLRDSGYALVMVTNQDGLGTPSFPLPAFQSAQDELLRLLEKEGIGFSEIFICPHFSRDACVCRKPKTGLVDAFVTSRGVDLRQSLMIGDRDADETFAQNLGCRFVRAESNHRFPLKELHMILGCFPPSL